MSEKKITVDLDNETFIGEKPKSVRKIPYSEKMLENLARGRRLLEEKKTSRY